MNVLYIEFNLIFKLNLVPSADLPYTCNAGYGFQAVVVAILVQCNLVGQWRARPHPRHIANQYAPQLRQLINTELADNAANLGDAWVVFHFERYALHLIVFHQLGFQVFRICDHRSELVKLEWLSIFTNSRLGEDGGTTILQLDGKIRCQKYG